MVFVIFVVQQQALVHLANWKNSKCAIL